MTLVCFAVPQEAKPFKAKVPVGFSVLVTGMGRMACERAIEASLKNARPSLVLTCGFAGGLNPALAPLTVLYSADDCGDLKSRLESAGAVPGTFFCADTVVTTTREKEQIRRSTGADAVEMESGHMRKLCRQAGIPSATVRVILDGAHANLPLDFNAVLGPDQRISPLKMAAAIASRPTLIPALIRLGTESKRAAERLTEVLLRFSTANSTDGGRSGCW